MKIKKNEIILYVGIILLYIVTISNSSTIINLPGNISDIMLFLSYSFLTVTTLLSTKNIKKLSFFAVCMIFNIILYINSRQTVLINLTLLLFALKETDIKKLIKLVFLLNCFVIFIHIGLYFINIILDAESLKFIYRGDNIRYSFFFEHPNVFSGFVFWTVAMHFYLKKKIYYIDYLIVFRD